jgi:hypothetical protein
MMGRILKAQVKELDVWKIAIFKKFWLVVVMFVAMTGFAQAVEIKGVRFSDTLVVEQAELKLNGVAVLKWAMLFDVYAGALYLPAGVRGKAWSNDVAKRLELSYFREIEAKGFAEASDKILQDNLSPAEYQTLAKRLRAFYGFFQDVKPGDRYSINYLPEQGTELRLNEQLLGQVPGADFAVAYFGIWLGAEPISKDFRNRLLEND